MRLLVLGGGGFLGYHAVEAALAAGHDVTVLSRSGEPPVPGVAVVTGDREGDLSGLRGRTWDAVLDTWTGGAGVRRTVELLSGAVATYGYVSGMSVYAPAGPPVPDETAPVRRAGEQPDDDPLQARSLAKLAGEAAVRDAFAGTALVVRVGIMVGPRDPSDRFTWWPVRLARAVAGVADRTVLAPGDPARPVQYSDARDVAAWAVGMLAAGRDGTFDAVGPGRREPLGDVLAACLRAAGGEPGDVEIVWADEGLLRGELRDVEEERRPLWFPEDQIPQEAVDSSAALAAGLRFRSTERTARDVLGEVRAAGRLDDLAAGLPAERERDLVVAARRQSDRPPPR